MEKVVRGSRSRARWTVVMCFVLALALPAFPVSAQSRFSGIVVFGTSLSDSGNAFALVGDQSTAPDFTLNPLLVPSAPYARGGHHFSNGATWVEQFAKSHGLEGSVRPAFATKNLVATNYAVGAARAFAMPSRSMRPGAMVVLSLPRRSDRFPRISGGCTKRVPLSFSSG